MTTCFAFNFQAAEAAEFYKTVFADFKEIYRLPYPPNSPGPEGEVMTITCHMHGQEFLFLNVGDMFTSSGSTTLMIDCQSQEELDHIWETLGSDGGQEHACGWITDKFGFTWQVIPAVVHQWMASPDTERRDRVMRKLWEMIKIELAPLQAEWDKTTP